MWNNMTYHHPSLLCRIEKILRNHWISLWYVYFIFIISWSIHNLCLIQVSNSIHITGLSWFLNLYCYVFLQPHYQPNCRKRNWLMYFLCFFFSIRKIIRFTILLQMICFLLRHLLQLVFLRIFTSFRLVSKTNILITDSCIVEQVYLNPK